MGLKAIPMARRDRADRRRSRHEFIILRRPARARSFATAAVQRPTPRCDGRGAPTTWRRSPRSDHALCRDRREARAGGCPIPPSASPRRAASRSAISSISAANIRKPMGATVAGPDGEAVPVQMGSYGIGVSRLVGAIIEASHDEAGIIWPEASRRSARHHQSAGRRCRLRPPPSNSTRRLQSRPRRSTTTARNAPGAKFATMDLMGLPWQIVIGPRGAAAARSR